MKIGIYGGTFNPIHYGHLRTAEEVIDLLSLDRMIFVPSGKTPFNKPQLAGAGHRYKMVQAAIGGNPRFEVSGIEIRTSGRSYTVDTIGKLKKKYRGSELYFVLGLDAFVDLPLWKQPDSLIQDTNLVVLSRPGHSFTDLAGSRYLKSLSIKSLKGLDQGATPSITFKLSDKTEGILCNVTGLNISATKIRELIRKDRNINYILPESVKSYIISHKLYGLK